MTLYLHYLQRIFLIACLRKNHSNSYIKKLKHNISKWEWFTGYYLKKETALKEKWLSLILFIINANLLSIFAIILSGILVYTSTMPQVTMYKLYVILVFKDLLIWLVLLCLAKFKKAN